jgi:hypothetical protein
MNQPIKLSVIQGGTQLLQVEVVDNNNTPVTTGTLTLRVREKQSDPAPFLVKTAPVGTPFSFGTSDTRNREPGYYSYSIIHVGAAGESALLPPSPFYIAPKALNFQSSYSVSTVPTLPGDVAVLEAALGALLPDGSPSLPGAPLDPRRTLVVPKMGKVALRINVTTQLPSGEYISGGNLVFTLKKSSQDSSALYTQVSSLVGTLTQFLVPASVFDNQDAGVFVYDIWYVDGIGTLYPVVPLSTLLLE